MPGPWIAAALAAKFFLYLAAFWSIGTFLVHRALRPALILPKRGIAAGLLAALALSMVGFALRGAALTGSAEGASDPEILGLLWQTPVGTALVTRCAGIALVALALALPGTLSILALVGGAGVFSWSFAQIGHVEATAWVQPVLVLHLLCLAFWIGVLSPLDRLSATDPAGAARLGADFGRGASVIVIVMLLAGLVLAVQLVGSIEALFTTRYGLALMAKVGVVVGLLALAALNKLRIVPALEAGEFQAAGHLRRSIRWEWAAFALIFAVTATFTTLFAPPMVEM